ncbi:unnamed protein product [Didymodactylos carnosus]|uniref:Uncharacterized protein n=1 Tax=Didymodactylos carnosus TaxID=1234261 RepID=A0A814JTB5_9BILA|nr:unnamed protein product [Didymodactylos carnosus]CAF1040071.1 unnamed protein product [Didymodactylos carnosus]CAF3624991.1 unnamed protein product [Didymodactylos carnosus]CAF3810308.1 unnamed protein product [Didymodactylos carnosus]
MRVFRKRKKFGTGDPTPPVVYQWAGEAAAAEVYYPRPEDLYPDGNPGVYYPSDGFDDRQMMGATDEWDWTYQQDPAVNAAPPELLPPRNVRVGSPFHFLGERGRERRASPEHFQHMRAGSPQQVYRHRRGSPVHFQQRPASPDHFYQARAGSPVFLRRPGSPERVPKHRRRKRDEIANLMRNGSGANLVPPVIMPNGRALPDPMFMQQQQQQMYYNPWAPPFQQGPPWGY